MKALTGKEILGFIKKGLPETPQKKILVNQLINAFSKGGDKTEVIGATAVRLTREVISRKDLIFEASLLNAGTNRVGIGTSNPKSKLHVVGIPIFANNAAAIGGGLTAGAFYRTGADPDPVCVVH